MSQCFRGQLEGHYVGVPATGVYSGTSGTASRYKLRIYRAVVRQIELLQTEGETDIPGEPEFPVELPESCFYQATIADTRLIGIFPRSCFEGAIYDVAVSQLEVTHSTIKDNKTYGRVCGEVYGRFLLPAKPASTPRALETDTPEFSATGVPESDAIAITEKLRNIDSLDVEDSTGRITAAEQSSVAEDEIEPLHPPTAPVESAHAPAYVPVPLLVAVMAIALALGPGIEPALLWLAMFVPITIVRLMLHGQFKVSPGQQVFAAGLVMVHCGCLGWLVLDWWTQAHAINLWAAGGLALTVLLASLLPSSLALLCTGAGLGLALFFGYGSVPSSSQSKDTSAISPERPTSTTPSTPRTNTDGSWPRRSSRDQ